VQASTASSATESPELPTESLLEAYRRMTLIRLFEERVSELYRNSEVPGFVHLRSAPAGRWR
jgi:2-oxoisovalerate dehydrogenase E1 component